MKLLFFITKQNVFRDKKARVTDHPMKDRLANHYKDDTWYDYKRFMEDGAEFIDAVMTGKIKEKQVWAPDMDNYQAFVESNGFNNQFSKVTESLVYEQVPVTVPEMTSEGQSQALSTGENQFKIVDMKTGEIFELPPEDRADAFGEVSLNDERLDV